jgi:N-acyl-D-aspartate/D-glutamate deacylase
MDGRRKERERMSTRSHDLVITGGRVIDPETGLDAVRNIGIRDGSIVAVSTDPLQGKATIDAFGQADPAPRPRCLIVDSP